MIIIINISPAIQVLNDVWQHDFEACAPLRYVISITFSDNYASKMSSKENILGSQTGMTAKITELL